MFSSKRLELGDLRGTIYDFAEVGEGLPLHNHTAENVHITIVCRGRVRAYSHDWSVEHAAGAVLNFRADEPHAIEALEPDTRIINIVKRLGGTVGQIDL